MRLRRWFRWWSVGMRRVSLVEIVRGAAGVGAAMGGVGVVVSAGTAVVSGVRSAVSVALHL